MLSSTKGSPALAGFAPWPPSVVLGVAAASSSSARRHGGGPLVRAAAFHDVRLISVTPSPRAVCVTSSGGVVPAWPVWSLAVVGAPTPPCSCESGTCKTDPGPRYIGGAGLGGQTVDCVGAITDAAKCCIGGAFIRGGGSTNVGGHDDNAGCVHTVVCSGAVVFGKPGGGLTCS